MDELLSIWKPWQRATAFARAQVPFTCLTPSPRPAARWQSPIHRQQNMEARCSSRGSEGSNLCGASCRNKFLKPVFIHAHVHINAVPEFWFLKVQTFTWHIAFRWWMQSRLQNGPWAHDLIHIHPNRVRDRNRLAALLNLFLVLWDHVSPLCRSLPWGYQGVGLWNASDHPCRSLQLCFCSLFNRFIWVSRLVAGHGSFAGQVLSIPQFLD